ncbi:reactive intermediate/imine deaminase [Candidatus Peregrinibacteria bacterium CG_4_10_14_0_2_um_filter_43_11]|nr:MAG: reactive intermediate/imine deaminase [Candidatus Peregrinibacteria bacterium CG_4_10_14_0_2_um_filter_43_11]
MKKIISTDKAPKAIGPYSQAVQYGDLIFCSGQIPLHPETMEVMTNAVSEQTRQAMDNLKAVLQATKSDLNKVIKTTIFLKNMDDFATVNEVYASYFEMDPPARATVEVSRLPKDVLVEIECIAHI